MRKKLTSAVMSISGLAVLGGGALAAAPSALASPDATIDAQVSMEDEHLRSSSDDAPAIDAQNHLIDAQNHPIIDAQNHPIDAQNHPIDAQNHPIDAQASTEDEQRR